MLFYIEYIRGVYNMKNFFMLFTLILYIIDATLIQINEKNNKAEKMEKANIKKWETISNLIVITSLLIIFIIIIVKFNIIAVTFNIIYYGGSISLYSFLLMNILLKDKNKDKNITGMELQALILIPLLVTSCYNILGNTINNLKIFDNYVIEVFIFKNIVKYFTVFFFIAMDIFIFFKELQQYLENKNEFKNNKKNKAKYIDLNVLNHEYANTKGKKGILFLLGYIHDLINLFFKIILSILYVYIFNGIRFAYVVLKKFAKKITQNFSMYVIIVKTFNISLIISLLITYYKLLINYNDSINIELYSIIITAIIIPIILEIIGDLKNK